MGYITTVLTPEERRRAGPKNGAQATATVSLDPLGGVSVVVASVPQGQGHRTVLAQVAADVFGLRPGDVRVVTELDTAKDAWSIASGNYSSRFAAAVAGAAHLACVRLRDRLARAAAGLLNVGVGDVVFADARVFARGNPDNSVGFARLAAAGHWAPGTLPEGEAAALRETVFWSPPELAAPNDADEINASLCYGFVFDVCAVEIDRVTAAVRIDKYVTMHDCGRVLHPGMLAGQVTGGFAHAVGAALYEEHVYAPDGGFLSGTLADYLVPTAMEVPEPLILHCATLSPFTPLGAKGVGEGNCMSTPVCIANAVADALGVADVTLPLLPSRLAPHVHGVEVVRVGGAEAARVRGAAGVGERALSGAGSVSVEAPRETVWRVLLDPDALAGMIPGVHAVRRVSATQFRAEVTLGVGPVQGRCRIEIVLSDMEPPRSVTLSGSADGALGFGAARGVVTLTEEGGVTRVAWRYDAAVGGKVASIGGRLLDGAARVIIGRFFAALAVRASGGGATRGVGGWLRLQRLAGWLRGLVWWWR